MGAIYFFLVLSMPDAPINSNKLSTVSFVEVGYSCLFIFDHKALHQLGFLRGYTRRASIFITLQRLNASQLPIIIARAQLQVSAPSAMARKMWKR